MIHSYELILSGIVIHFLGLVLSMLGIHSFLVILSSRLIHSVYMLLSWQLIHLPCRILSWDTDSFFLGDTVEVNDSLQHRGTLAIKGSLLCIVTVAGI